MHNLVQLIEDFARSVALQEMVRSKYGDSGWQFEMAANALDNTRAMLIFGLEKQFNLRGVE